MLDLGGGKVVLEMEAIREKPTEQPHDPLVVLKGFVLVENVHHFLEDELLLQRLPNRGLFACLEIANGPEDVDQHVFFLLQVVAQHLHQVHVVDQELDVELVVESEVRYGLQDVLIHFSLVPVMVGQGVEAEQEICLVFSGEVEFLLLFQMAFDMLQSPHCLIKVVGLDMFFQLRNQLSEGDPMRLFEDYVFLEELLPPPLDFLPLVLFVDLLLEFLELFFQSQH